MNGQHDEQHIDRQLATMTVWGSSEPQLWKRALDAAARNPKVARVHRILHWPLPSALAATIALLLSGIVVVGLMLPSMGKAREAARAPAWTTLDQEASSVLRSIAPEKALPARLDDKAGLVGGEGIGGSVSSPAILNRGHSAAIMNEYYTPQADTIASAVALAIERHIVRKATIELTSGDVRAVFLKAMHLVSDAGGEYVQDSTLTGSGKAAQANLTLRIGADRLAAVLNELRTLGTVTSENIGGEDVTNQVVDLEARLRNEQRVEVELLQLMEKRPDAALKEILELRDHIAHVRQQIEQLTAQRERLSRLVSLATVLVIIRAEDAPKEEPKEESLGDYFGESLTGGWRSGLLFLADTVAGTLRVLIGGLVWWILLLIGLLAVRSHYQRRAAAAVMQP